MKINKREFRRCAKQLFLDPKIQEVETESFRFIKVENMITVKFKKIDHLTGYFTIDEIKNWKTLTVILKTLEKEISKHG